MTSLPTRDDLKLECNSRLLYIVPHNYEQGIELLFFLMEDSSKLNKFLTRYFIAIYMIMRTLTVIRDVAMMEQLASGIPFNLKQWETFHYV